MVNWLKQIPGWVIALLLALVLEGTVCQYKSWLTMSNEPVTDVDLQIYNGGELNEDGSYTVTENFKLKLNEINQPVNALRILLRIRDASGEETESSYVSLNARDEANEDYFCVQERQIFPDLEESQYVRLHLSGICKSMVLIIAAESGSTVTVESIILNPKIPMHFSVLRVILLFLTGVFAFYCCTGKRFYSIPYDAHSKPQNLLTAGAMGLCMIVFAGAVYSNPTYAPETVAQNWEHQMQYYKLAVALADGQLYLEDTVPDSLLSMENPYDFKMRDRLQETSGDQYLWDTAFYNGKYYVYFGVLPVILFYLPWYLVTGTAFPTRFGVLLCGFAFLAGVFYLARALVQKYCKQSVPYVAWLLSVLLFACGSGMLNAMRRPDMYYLPIAMGAALSVIGIGLWISSVEETCVVAWKLVAGCCCMALVAACRPQMVLGSFLIFPIYWDAVFRKRLLFSRKSVDRTALAAAAYLTVAVLLMIYNARRFGSPFDFGANYNLTTNDMTRRGIDLERLPYALFRYLFQPPTISAVFPYLKETENATSYAGTTIREGMFGGFLTVNLLVPGAIYGLLHRRWFRERKQVWYLGAGAMLLALLIVCVDAEGAGVLLRYTTDFGWLLYLGAFAVWMILWEVHGGRNDRLRLMALAQNTAFCVGMAFALLMIFCDNGERLADTAPELFYKFYYQLAFWG